MDAFLEDVLDGRLMRMGIVPETADGPFGRERLVALGGVPCRLLSVRGTLALILTELTRNDRAYAVARHVVGRRAVSSVVHGPRAIASPAAMSRLARNLWDHATIAALREAAHA
jgi:hypothetical protein